MKNTKQLFLLSVLALPMLSACTNIFESKTPCEAYSELRGKMENYEAERSVLDDQLQQKAITDIQYQAEMAGLNKEYDYVSLSAELESAEAECEEASIIVE